MDEGDAKGIVDNYNWSSLELDPAIVTELYETHRLFSVGMCADLSDPHAELLGRFLDELVAATTEEEEEHIRQNIWLLIEGERTDGH